jgi:hypothetical protein
VADFCESIVQQGSQLLLSTARLEKLFPSEIFRQDEKLTEKYVVF